MTLGPGRDTMDRALAVKLLCCLLIANTAGDGEEEWGEEELGTLPEDMAEYQWQGGVRYSTDTELAMNHREVSQCPGKGKCLLC